MNIPESEYKPTYIRIAENTRADLRLDKVDGEIQITVYSCPISAIDSLIEKLQALKIQLAEIKTDYSDLKLGDFDLYEEREKRLDLVIKPAAVKDEPEEHPIMTAVLGQKPDPTGWYKNALQKAASVPAPLKQDVFEETAPPMPTPRKGKNIINIIGVKSKDFTRFGTKYPGTVNMKHNADIAKQQWIRIYGLEPGRFKYDPETKVSTHYTLAFDLTFKMGDTCVYDSYNLVYTGKIVGIGAKTVTIEKGNYRRNTVLDIQTFVQRNYDYDAKKIFERNSNWYD